MTSPLEEMKNSSSVRFLKATIDSTGLEEQAELAIRYMLGEIREMAMQTIKDRQVAALREITPFAIGTAYIRKIAYNQHRNADGLLRPTDTSLGNIMFTESVSEIRNEWLNLPNPVPQLAGILFVADTESKGSSSFRKLTRLGARMLGEERVSLPLHSRQTRGGAYFVANRLAAFALNEGMDPILKTCAEYHGLFTFSCMKRSNKEKALTVTARFEDDLRTIAMSIGKPLNNRIFENPEIVEGINVVVVLGLRNYRADMVLFEIADKLLRKGFTVLYNVRRTEISSIKSTCLRRTASLVDSPRDWEEGMDSICPPEDDWHDYHIRPNDDWHFLVAPCNGIFFVEQVRSKKGRPISVTIPIRGRQLSVEVVRKRGAQIQLLDFMTVCTE